jgi:UDP-N-acetylmuramate dehydrogenase
LTDIAERIEGIAGAAVRQRELLSLHTTFGVGGPCDLMVWVSTMDALREVLAASRAAGLPVFVLGRGSNVLVRDGGVDGVVVKLVDEFARIEAAGCRVEAGAGASLGDVVSKATSAGIGGLEFLAGIPGTVGGAAVANAGGKDVWFGHRLVDLSVLDADLKLRRLTGKDIAFGYRTSGLAPDWVVVEAVMEGHPTSVEEARHEVEAYLARRRDTQPVGERSAGCIFRNPAKDSAGRLIETAGLKGVVAGGAEVSQVHANFIVNTGGATAREILELIGKIKQGVKSVHGVDLELEIGIVGKD